MPELRSADGRYLAADQGRNSFVLYDTVTGAVLWDRWSHEGGLQHAFPVEDAPPHEMPPPLSPPDAPGTRPPGEIVRPPSGGGGTIRVTDERDGQLVNRGYSYWPSCVVDGDTAYVFAGHVDGRPRFFSVDLISLAVTRLAMSIPYTGTAEGWYWDAQGWIYVCDGPRLQHINPFTGEDLTVFDISASYPGHRITQAHSSDDGRVHCATVQQVVNDGPYPNIGTVVYRGVLFEVFPAKGTLDESAITPDGRWLIIKENDDNRIIELESRETRRLSDVDGAVGHSDTAPGLLVGEDNIHGACVAWDLSRPLTPGNRRELFQTWGMGHLSIRAGRCLLSDATHLSLVDLAAGGVTPLLAHGMTGSGYEAQTGANLSPCGRVACYMSNVAGRLDAYLVPI